MLAENNTGSWGMIEIFDLRSCKPTVAVSTPSIVMVPSVAANRNREAMRVDLPAPVLPTIPT